MPGAADLDDVLDDPRVDAVVVATPPQTHHPLVKRALEAGKHVLVEKPLATTLADAAGARRRSPSARPRADAGPHVRLQPGRSTRSATLIRDGVIGEVYFVTSSRMNLGKYQRDGVVCDLAPHDLSILLYWLDEPVVQVVGVGAQRVPGRACPRRPSSR